MSDTICRVKPWILPTRIIVQGIVNDLSLSKLPNCRARPSTSPVHSGMDMVSPPFFSTDVRRIFRNWGDRHDKDLGRQAGCVVFEWGQCSKNVVLGGGRTLIMRRSALFGVPRSGNLDRFGLARRKPTGRRPEPPVPKPLLSDPRSEFSVPGNTGRAALGAPGTDVFRSLALSVPALRGELAKR